MEGLANVPNEEDVMVDNETCFELWKMLWQDLNGLDDKTIEALLREENQKQIKERISSLSYSFPRYLEQIRSYRAKKQNMKKLSNEELLAIRARIADRRAHILRTVPDEDLGDSFFESPPMDSEENIVYEILEERGIG